jgi:hypothetical protein
MYNAFKDKFSNFLNVESSNYPITEKIDMQLRRTLNLGDNINLFEMDFVDEAIED